MKKAICPITRKPFECNHCKAVGINGKCPYMIADEWIDDTFRTIRKLVEEEIKK